jgi:hypothetical protein
MSISFSEQIATAGASSLSAKGDILVHNGTSATRHAVGTNGQAIYANTASTNGVYWSTAPTAPAFGLVKISTASVTADVSSVTISGIPSSYKDLYFVGISSNTSTTRSINEARIRVNSESGSSYNFITKYYDMRTAGGTGTYTTAGSGSATSISVVSSVGNQSETLLPGYFSGWIYQYGDTQKHKTGRYESGCVYNDTQDLGNSPYAWGVSLGEGVFTFKSNSAITSLSFFSGSSLGEGIKSGSYFVLYGRK